MVFAHMSFLCACACLRNHHFIHTLVSVLVTIFFGVKRRGPVWTRRFSFFFLRLPVALSMGPRTLDVLVSLVSLVAEVSVVMYLVCYGAFSLNWSETLERLLTEPSQSIQQSQHVDACVYLSLLFCFDQTW